MDRWMEEVEAVLRELPGSAREIWGEAFREALVEVQGDRSKAAAMAWRAFKKPEAEERKVAGGKTAGQGTLMVVVRGGTPEWVRMLGNDGLVLKEGRYPCCVDRKSLKAILADWERRDRILRIFGAELRGAGIDRVAGWMQELKLRQEGLWIRVEWTEEALGDIGKKGPAYLVLNFILDENQKPVALRQASLSYYPRLNLWASLEQGEQDGKDDKNFDNCMGEAGQDGSLEATEVEKIWGEGKEGAEVKKLAELGRVWAGVQGTYRFLGDTPPAKMGQEIETALQPGQAGQRSPEDQKRLEDSVDTAKEKRIAEAVARGWIKPEQRDWASVYASRDWQGFNEFLDLAAGALGMGRKWPWRWLLFWRKFFR